MLKTIRKTIKKHDMLTLGDGVVVGLSGGVDSVTLLATLLAIKDELDLEVYAIHINHNLRSDAAKADEAFVRLLCESLGVPLLVFSVDVTGFAQEKKLSTEEAGRVLRYKYLRLGLEKFNAQKIAVGHNMDDNAETVLLNLFRGTGLKGLCGIPPTNGQIIRPLIDINRKEIEAYATENGLAFVTDETNATLDYSRNYVRNEIIPAICKQFGQKVPDAIARMSQLLRADEDALAVAAEDAYKMLIPATADNICKTPLPSVTSNSHVDPPTTATMRNCSCGHSDISNTPCTPQEIIFPIDNLLSYPPAISSRVIRQAISTLRGNNALHDIQSNHIDSIIDLAQGRTGREVSLPGLKARRQYTSLIIYRPEYCQVLTHTSCHPLHPNTPVTTPKVTVVLNLHMPQNLDETHCTHAFDYGKVKQPLVLRTRRPGDIITFASGTKKLQDYFTDTKTPRNKRDEIPLLADGSQILWIMDKHNRTNTAYQPTSSKICWVTVKRKR